MFYRMQVRKSTDEKNTASKKEIERKTELMETARADIGMMASDRVATSRNCKCSVDTHQNRIGICDECHLDISEETDVCLVGNNTPKEKVGPSDDLKDSIKCWTSCTNRQKMSK